MIATAVLGSVHDPQGADLVAGREVDRVDVGAGERVKRVQRLTTRGGREIGLRLPGGAPALRDGDILAIDPDGDPGAIVVEIRATDVLLIRPRSMHEMGVVAHALGNRHLPAQFFDADSTVGREAGGTVMLVEYDHTVVHHLEHIGVPYRREDRVLEVPLRHAEHTH